MNVLGIEIVEFFKSDWPEGWFIDNDELEVTDKDTISDADGKEYSLSNKYDLDRFGSLCSYDEDTPTLSSYFRKWKKEKTHVTFIIEIEKSREVEIRTLLNNAGVVLK